MEKDIGQVIWFTGLSGSGKSTICRALATELRQHGVSVQILDGDELRRGLCSDLTFTVEDRLENVRRVAHAARLLMLEFSVVLVAVISPFRVGRDLARSILPEMIEVYVDAPLATCERRDPKHLYKRARSGLILNFTGIDSPYEVPLTPDLICYTDHETISESTHKVMKEAVKRLGLSSS